MLVRKVFLEKPFLAALATSVFKCVSSDAFVQIFVEGNTHLDYQRVGCFFALSVWPTRGGVSILFVQSHVETVVRSDETETRDSRRYRGNRSRRSTLCRAVCVQFPTFLAIKMWSENKTTAGEFYRTLKTLWNDTVFETMRALWIVWVPAQMFNFWVVPRHFPTIPFMNVVGFGWNGIGPLVHGQRKIWTPRRGKRLRCLWKKCNRY